MIGKMFSVCTFICPFCMFVLVFLLSVGVKSKPMPDAIFCHFDVCFVYLRLNMDLWVHSLM